MLQKLGCSDYVTEPYEVALLALIVPLLFTYILTNREFGKSLCRKLYQARTFLLV